MSTGGMLSTPATSINHPGAITVGPDRALWIDSGRLTVKGQFTPISGVSAVSMTTGPDGALWAASTSNAIERITTSGKVTTYIGGRINSPKSITAGPDGALWFTNFGNNSIGRITTSGVITNYPTNVDPYGIVAGPDGALWFTSISAPNYSIGRITTAGVVTSYPTTVVAPFSITVGPDGALWFTSAGSDSIGRITTSGVSTTYTDPSIVGSSEYGIATGNIAAGSDGALWFTNFLANTIGRVTPPTYVNVTPSSGGPSATLTASGGGFIAGETVRISYKTKLAAPNPTGVTVCTATATPDGTFTCTGSVPSATVAGSLGAHKILAKGLGSQTNAPTIFTLT